MRLLSFGGLLRHSSKVTQQVCGTAGLRPSGRSPGPCSALWGRPADGKAGEWRVDGASRQGEVNSGFQRCKSRFSRFLLLASPAFLWAALLPEYPSLRRTSYRNFPIACSSGFLSSSLSRIPSGPQDTGVEEIIANPWHTSWKSMIRKRWSCTFRRGRGKTFHLCVMRDATSLKSVGYIWPSVSL